MTDPQWGKWWRLALLGVPAWLFYVPVTWLTTDATPLQALGLGTRGIAVAGVLSLGVWWGTSRRPWIGSPSVSWLAIHGGAAFAFGFLWVVSVETVEGLLRWDVSWYGIVNAPFFFGRVLIGTWLYMALAGAAYAIQTGEQLEAAETRASEAEARAAIAQLTALRRKLNPHFLFNALNSVTALIQRQPQAAEVAVDHIAVLLRSAIRDADAVVPLADEWSLVERYLDLERLRFGDRLRVEMHIEPGAEECAVPRFALQTLVENATRHGIAPQIGGGCVAISAVRSDERLILEVSDDGTGFANSTVSGNGGTGLTTLRESLIADFPDGTLSVEAHDARGTVARLDIPFRRME